MPLNYRKTWVTSVSACANMIQLLTGGYQGARAYNPYRIDYITSSLIPYTQNPIPDTRTPSKTRVGLV